MMHQLINKSVAFLFIWVAGLGIVTYLILQIDKTDFAHLYAGEEARIQKNISPKEVSKSTLRVSGDKKPPRATGGISKCLFI